MDAIPPGTDLSKIPLGRNPNGQPGDFTNAPNLIGAVQGVGIALAIITLGFLITRLRIYVKLNRGLVLDDYFLIIAYGMALAYTTMVGTLGRLSKHAWDTPLSEINEDYLKKLLATSIIYGPMFFFAKAAILLLYHRAFKPKTWMRWSVYFVMVIMFGAYWMTVPLNFIYCMPHHGNPWDFAVLNNCNHLKIPGLVHGGMNIAADVIMVLLPIPIVVKLHAPLSKKIAICGIFATGLLALVCSVLAVYYRVQIIRAVDPLWANAQAYIAIQSEIYAAICVACMPSLANMWNVHFKETRLYATLQSLLRSTGRTTHDSLPSARKSTSSTESVSALQSSSKSTDLYGHYESSIRALEDGYEVETNNGVYRMVTVDISSHKARNST